MIKYKIKQVNPDEYEIIRKIDRESFEYNGRGSDSDFHEVFADNIRRSPYYIPELDLAAVTDDGSVYLGHAIFSVLPMGEPAVGFAECPPTQPCLSVDSPNARSGNPNNSSHIVWLNSLAVRHGEKDDHVKKSFEYQRKGIGTALVMRGLEIAKSLGYTGCMTCGNPAVYQKKMGFLDCRILGIDRDDSVDDPEGCVFAIELTPGGFDNTNKLLSYSFYDFTKIEKTQIEPKTLTQVLSKMLGMNIIRASYQSEQLQGGTLGDVRLVTGIAVTDNGGKVPYKVVLKTQKKWERPGDPESWRREYDMYVSDFGKLFSDSFRWPACYHAEINGDALQIWMEHIDGKSSRDLTIEDLEFAAKELGRFQGMMYKQHDIFQHITCLSDTGFIEREHAQWHEQIFTYEFLISDECRLPKFLKEMLRDNKIEFNDKSFEYNCLRSDVCDLPEHLKQMLIDIDDRRDMIFAKIKQLPVILCHRDFWIENIFLTKAGIVLIDWDGVGYGYICEDIASLIFDDTDVEYIDEYYRRLVPAYYGGLSEYIDISAIEDLCIQEMVLIKFGYRILQEYMFTQSADKKSQQITALQKIYEMRTV